VALTALAICLLASCSGGSGTTTQQGGSPGKGGKGSGNDGSGETVADGEIVGRVALRAPDEEKFLLRATLPLPPGTATADDALVPLAVVDGRRRTTTTQVNVVTRYPDPQDGLSVVEVVAEVERPRGAAPGSEIAYEVAYHPHPPGKMMLSKTVRDTLGEEGALTLSAADVFGNVYQADLFGAVLNKERTARQLRNGPLMKEFAVHELLLPKHPKGGSEGTLPHLMGVHAYITTYARRNYFTLDLHVHNGMDGLDKEDPRDDAQTDLYFKSLDLTLPAGWKTNVCFPSPTTGVPHEESGHSVVPVVKARSDGKLHFLPQQGRFVRRLVVYRESSAAEALALLDQEYLAFCRPGEAPGGGELWSWWNPRTARYFPQAHRLPELDFLNADTLRAGLAATLAERSAQVGSGHSGSYPLASPALGWAQPWGVDYGGMTGGDEINLIDGLETAWTGSREGYLLAQLVGRCYIDRQPTALYDLEGRPTRVEDLLVTEGQGAPYVDCAFFLTPTPGSDPFGFQDAPTFQKVAVQNAGLVPPYEAELRNWMPIDFQHHVRFTRALKVLVWLGNDTLAKEQLEQASELVRLSFHEYPNSQYGWLQPSGLRVRMDHVATFPGQGVDFQRGEAWSLDCAVAAYAAGSDELRARYYPWFEKVARLIEDGQSTCTGNIMATAIGKVFDGNTYVRYTPYSSFGDNTLQGLRRHVFDTRDPVRAEKLAQAIVGNAQAQISKGFWNEALGMPWCYVGVGPVDQQGEFCHDIPGWANCGYGEDGSYYSSFAYAYETSGNQEFLFRAAQMLGGGNLEQRLKEKGLSNIAHHAALLALLQAPPNE